MDTVLTEKLTGDALQAQIVPIKTRRRRIEWPDVEWIAEQVADGLTELHAVNSLGKFTYSAWNAWKCRGKKSAKVSNLFARMIGSRQKNFKDEIKKAATGTGGVRHDWRAAQMLAGLHDDRFRNSPGQQNTTNNMLAIGGDASQVNKLIAMFAGQVRCQVDDKPAAPALPAPQDDKPIDV